MRKLIAMAVGMAALYQAARMMGINSWADLKKLVLPAVKELEVA